MEVRRSTNWERLDVKWHFLNHVESSATKMRAPKRISPAMNESQPEDMMKSENHKLAGSRLDVCPMVGANCRGNEHDSRGVGYEWRGQSPSYNKLVNRMYEFRPLSEVIALRLGARELL